MTKRLVCCLFCCYRSIPLSFLEEKWKFLWRGVALKMCTWYALKVDLHAGYQTLGNLHNCRRFQLVKKLILKSPYCAVNMRLHYICIGNITMEWHFWRFCCWVLDQICRISERKLIYKQTTITWYCNYRLSSNAKYCGSKCTTIGNVVKVEERF